MTDERQGDALWPALEALPRGSGVIVRHYGLAERERCALARAVRKIARRRALVTVIAGDIRLARRCGMDGFHMRSAKIGDRGLLRTLAVHSARELATAHRAKADLVFISPVFPTRSHPGAPGMGRLRFAALARRARCPVIALGGMNAERAYGLRDLGAYGWAAIGALTPNGR